MDPDLSGRDVESFEELKRVVSSRLPFDCARYSDSFLARRFEVRLRANRLESYRDYVRVLEGGVHERELLLRELTIHTTNFFRDSDMWVLFMAEVIPTLAKVKRAAGDRTIRIWSAGCSTGEEPVTIALCLFEALGPDLGGFSVQIEATDLDRETIARAREARYEELQFRELPKDLFERYFQRAAPGISSPIPSLLRLIRYGVDDLHSTAKRRRMDIIFCRNTVIYFDQEAKKELYAAFFESLNPGGFFVMGKTETLLGPARNRFQVFSTPERIFFKE